MVVALSGIGGAILGMLLGGLLGFFGPFLLAQLYVAGGGDPTAAGALSFFPIVLVPLGAIGGAVLGAIVGVLLAMSFRRPPRPAQPPPL